MKQNTPVTIGILIFKEAEELDFVGPLEVFGMAATLGERCWTMVIAETLSPVRCAHGLRVLPEQTVDTAPAVDLLVVPGGPGARLYARHNARLLEFVRQQKGMVASVCTGALVLAAAGLLGGLEATTHYSRFDMLREYDQVKVREGVRFLMHDRIATSAGVTAGIDLSLALAARFFGESVAERIAQNIEWDAKGGESVSRWRFTGK
jgi:transcriptional regulator GlxA family with amidase domain